jgi:glucan phosphoethanolaminetransferase (alkaline phosphatase superfamily)
VTELSRDLYFIGALFTYLLWAAVLKLRQMHTRVIQIVLALGVYFSAYAASYSLYGIDPPNLLWRGICYITALWLPIAWGYAFLKVPAEARLATAQIATGHQ